MAHRIVLTERQRAKLFNIPTDEPTLLRNYTLSDEDLELIKKRRRSKNKLGFALQLCVLRYPGRLLQPGELIPNEALSFIGAQIGLSGDELLDYACREETRYEHAKLLQKLYGFHLFEGSARTQMCRWLDRAAEYARSNEGLVQSFVEECRRRQIIVPASSTLERLCADALVSAENQILKRISERLDDQQSENLLSLLSDTVDGRLTRFVWLRQFEIGNNSNDMNQLMDRLEWIAKVDIPEKILNDIPAHRISQLRRQGERYYADGLRDLPENRKLSILAVCMVEWKVMISDVIIETHDRITGKLYRSCERICQAQIEANKDSVQKALKAFSQLGSSLLLEKEGSCNFDRAVGKSCGWQQLEEMVELANGLTTKISIDALDFITTGYGRFRRYMPRFLKMLDIRSKPAAGSLMKNIDLLKEFNEKRLSKKKQSFNFSFARPKWRQNQQAKEQNRKYWELAIYFALRDAFRSRDIWLKDSRRYRNLSVDLMPSQEVEKCGKLAVPLKAKDWIESRKKILHEAFECVGKAAQSGQLPNAIIQDGQLRLEKLETNVPSHADEFVLELYRHMPSCRITDILQETNEAIGFTDAFTNLRTGAPCKDKLGLLNVILADGINLGLKKMSEATNTHTFWQLLRIAQWHVQDEAYKQALAMVIEAQSKLPLAQIWGDGTSSSSDGQFFPAGGTGEAMNVINAKYGHTPGLKAYTHFSDQYGPFFVQNIPATVSEAPYILDGLVLSEAGSRIREHYTDTGGFTDHVFAMCSILGYRFAPRIRGLSQKKLYAFDPKSVHKVIRPLIAAKCKEEAIERNWPDILRLSASTTIGKIAPSQALRKLSSYSQQNDLAFALREIGRIERTIFILSWIIDADLQRRAQVGLNKGEAHHALKRAINFNRRGEIRDRTSEGQNYRMAGLNLLTSIIIYWNTMKLGDVVAKLKKRKHDIPTELLPHVSPLGWEHIMLTGEYRWKNSLA